MTRDPELIVELKMVPLCNPAADRALSRRYHLKGGEEEKPQTFTQSDISLPAQYYISTGKKIQVGR